MKVQEFSLLTDENIQSEVIAFLREKGFDIKDVKEEGLIGCDDKYLLEFAFEEKRVILTHDSDFGRLVFTESTFFAGIIYLRPGHFDPAFTIKSINAILQTDLDVKTPFILVAENIGSSVKIRYRQM